MWGRLHSGYSSVRTEVSTQLPFKGLTFPLDVVGFFPQMLTVLVSTMVVLCVLATPQPPQDGGIVLEKGVITIEYHTGSPAAA